MVRMLAVGWAVLALAIPDVCYAGISHASPTDDPGRCNFTLTPPRVVQVSGVSYVQATISAGACTLHAYQNMSTVCLSIEGDESSGQCATRNDPNAAVLYYVYRPGATYVEKGQGCANFNTPPYIICEDFLPSRITL